MKTNKKRKILFAVLTCAVAVFLYDRLSSGSNPMRPNTVEAATLEEQDLALAESPNPSTDPTEACGMTRHKIAVANRLEKLAESGAYKASGIRDAFCPSAAWVGRPAEVAPVLSPESETKTFVQRHRLTATVCNPVGGTAIINGRCVMVGQSVGKFELVAVDRSSATLASGDMRVTLHLSKDGKTAPASGGDSD